MKELEFFRFDTKSMLSIFCAFAVSLKKDILGKNQQWNVIKGHYAGIDFPVIFKQHHGKKMTDILETGWPSLHLISDRMKQILEENNLTGWQTYPVKVYDKKGNEVLGYNGLSIIGRCAPIDYEKSEIIEKRRVLTGPLREYYKGKHIDVALWDKSDFFMPTNSVCIFITEKTATILKKNKITNLELENTKDTEVDVDNIKKKS